MKTIRTSAFETNSSSTHSLTISVPTEGDRIDLNYIPDEDGNISINMDQGKGEGIPSNPKDRMSLLYGYSVLVGNKGWWTNVDEVCKEHTGAKNIFLTTRYYDRDNKGAKTVEIHIGNGEKILGVDYSKMNTEGEFGEDYKTECVEETYYYYGDSDRNVEYFIETIEKILSDKDLIKKFIFSSTTHIGIYTWFDG